jgi:translation initiation factor IF-2
MSLGNHANSNSQTHTRTQVRINRDSFLTCENAEIAVLAFDREPVVSDLDRDEHLVTHRQEGEDEEATNQEQRQPIVAVMGHVDHGKTTLLDTIRNQSGKTTSQEAGGITQSVRAFEATFGDLRSTFIDTPGHAAFMAMRESGAAATDVVLLVVSAKDGVKDQTLETLRIATQHELPIVLALNKIDLLDQYERENLRQQVESDLLTHGFASESLGGEIQVVEISAKTSEGLENLEEALMLQTEILELNTNLAAPGEALILESQIDPQLGTCGVRAWCSRAKRENIPQIFRVSLDNPSNTTKITFLSLTNIVEHYEQVHTPLL